MFIVGPHRAGTTMLREILGRHPDVAVTPELRFFDLVMSVRGRKKEPTYEFIKRSLNKIRRVSTDPRWQKVDFRRLEKDLEDTTDFRDYFLKLAQATASKKEYEILIEKTPVNVFFVPLIKKLFPKAKTVYIMRDGREVCASACKRWGLKKWGHLKFASEWLLTAKEYFKHIKKIDHFFIRYEDIVSKPHQSLKKLFNYLDIDYKKDYIKGIGQNSSFEEFKNKHTIYASRHYRDFFNEKQKRQIEYFLRKYLKKFSYEIEFKRYKVSPKVKILFWFLSLKNKLYFWLKERGRFELYRKLKRIKKFFLVNNFLILNNSIIFYKEFYNIL